MITGVHAIIYSTDPDADRAFFRDVLHLEHVDAGEGWLIFALPPAELGIHPADQNGTHELYLTCDDIESFVGDMAKRGIAFTPPVDQSWGRITYITLPGGGQLGVYQPRHPQTGNVTTKNTKNTKK